MQTINLHIYEKSVIPVLYAKQGDVGRKFKVIITDGTDGYAIPADVNLSVWYSGTSGDGNYSVIDGRSAFTISGNTVEVELITQMLNNKGGGNLCLIMTKADGTQIGTWNIPYVVEEVPGLGSEAATQYRNSVEEVLAAEARTEAAANRSEEAADRSEEAVSRIEEAVAPQMLWQNEDDSLEMERMDIDLGAAAEEFDLLLFTFKIDTEADLHTQCVLRGDGFLSAASEDGRIYLGNNSLWITSQSNRCVNRSGSMIAVSDGYAAGEIDNSKMILVSIHGIHEMAYSRDTELEQAVAEKVSFTEQDLTDAQKAQARGNIGADDLAIVCTAVGNVIAITDAINRPLRGLTIFGMTTQDGTPTLGAPADFVNIGDGGSVFVSITDGTEDNTQQLPVSTPSGLPGVPVSSGGNYTDADGQQWVCDEINFARGLYVQRTVRLAWTGGGSYDSAHGYVAVSTGHSVARRGLLCNIATEAIGSFKAGNIWKAGDNDPRYIIGIADSDGNAAFESLDDFWAAVGKVEVLAILAAPIETALTAEELAQYAALHTNKLNTTVLNDAGAYMAVSYVADTKTYIDNKFTELAAAIVNS